LFTRESMLASDWYRQRLVAKHQVDVRLARTKAQALEAYCADPMHSAAVDRLNLRKRLEFAKQELARCESPKYLESLQGTLGVDPVLAVNA
jgi:hypothetical protein